MAQQHPAVNKKLHRFIKRQKVFFVSTAASDGRINLSPKGMDTFRIANEHTALWLNLTGSGNETAAHLFENDRMTIMFCAFEGNPLILRLYGHAKVIYPRDKRWNNFIAKFPKITGARQIFEMKVDYVQTSCGFGVPQFNFIEERDTLIKWAENKGDSGLSQYWQEKNQVSLDGLPTKILEESLRT